MLLALYPGNAAALETAYQASLANVKDGAAKTHGIAVGQQTAAAILALRANDGRNAGGTFTTSGGIGIWVPTPPGFLPPAAPWGRNITPWTMTSRFSELLEEAGLARIYGGMHYRNSVEAGQKLGRKVVRHMLRHHFRPTHERHDDDARADDDQDDD